MRLFNTKASILFFAVLIAGIFVMGCSENAGENNKTKNKRVKEPQITWRDLSYIDTIQVGDTIVRDYIFYNTGWKPVVVKHAISNRPECICRVPQREVPIGEQDTVRITCLFKEVEERAGVNVIIEHNTPQQEMTLIYIAKVNSKR